MKIGIIGFGSVGKRHYENCLALGHSAEVASVHKKRRLTQKNYDLIIIASKTSNRYEDILKFRNYSDTFLIEKPIAKSTSEAIKIKRLLKNKVALVGYTLIFNPLILAVKKILDKKNLGEIYQAQIHCGSYLPDWRTGDYRTKYSADRKKGGGVLRELVHEINYAQFLFPGPTGKISGFSKKISNLEIKSEDTALLTFSQPTRSIVTTLNYFQRLPERYLKIYGQKGTLFCDLIGKTLKIFGPDNKPALDKEFIFERNDMFLDELRFAIKVASGKAKVPEILGLNQAIKDLNIIEKIETGNPAKIFI